MSENERQRNFDRGGERSERGPRGDRGPRGARGPRGDRDDLDEHEDSGDFDDRPRGRRRPGGGGGGRGRRRKEDYFVVSNTTPDYKDTDTLRRFITDQGKIRPRRQTGLSAKNQRRVAQAIKRARHMALLPFTNEQTRR